MEFAYSTDFRQINDTRFRNWCLHLVCLEGEGSFVFHGRRHCVRPDDIAIISSPDTVSGIEPGGNLKVEFFAAPSRFLNSLLPSNNFGIGGEITLHDDPVLHAGSDGARRFLCDIRNIESRMADTSHPFYRELMGSLCLTMMYDLFALHCQRNATSDTSDRCVYVVKELLSLLRAGTSMRQRSVAYYAGRMNVTPEYLSKTVRRTTGCSVTAFIDRYTLPILKRYLNDGKLSATQIADAMNFASLSYFSRYTKKLLGMTPKEYRKSRQPRKM